MTQEVLTLACGKQIYFEMAATLARSFRIHHENSDIAFTLATDDPSKIPPDVAEWIQVHVIEKTDAIGFELKLNLDHYAKCDSTLFIDADCLVTGDLRPLFEKLSDIPFTALGKNVSEGEWFGDLAERCKAIETKELPVFVGALYYFERGEQSDAVFTEARNRADEYDDLGIVRLRGRKNEEPLISIGMARAGLPALPDTGEYKCDVMGFSGSVRVNIPKGEVVFNTPRPDTLLAPDSAEQAHPLIAHFNDAYTQMWEYRKEAARLRHILAGKQAPPLAAALSTVSVEIPGRLTHFLKETLRPIYHRVFGVRKLKQNERI